MNAEVRKASKQTILRQRERNRKTIEQLRASNKKLRRQLQNRDELISALEALDYHPSQTPSALKRVQEAARQVRKDKATTP